MDCVIRKWTPADAAELAIVLSDKNIQKNLRDGLPYPYSERDATTFITAMLGADPQQTFSFAVAADGKLVGCISAFRQENIHRRTAELGYYVGEKYQGRGIMTKAVRQICSHIFNTTDIVRIYAEPFAHNTASCRVLEKNGFQYEGTLRKNAIKEGQILDMKMYAKVK